MEPKQVNGVWWYHTDGAGAPVYVKGVMVGSPDGGGWYSVDSESGKLIPEEPAEGTSSLGSGDTTSAGPGVEVTDEIKAAFGPKESWWPSNRPYPPMMWEWIVPEFGNADSAFRVLSPDWDNYWKTKDDANALNRPGAQPTPRLDWKLEDHKQSINGEDYVTLSNGDLYKLDPKFVPSEDPADDVRKMANGVITVRVGPNKWQVVQVPQDEKEFNPRVETVEKDGLKGHMVEVGPNTFQFQEDKPDHELRVVTIGDRQYAELSDGVFSMIPNEADREPRNLEEYVTQLLVDGKTDLAMRINAFRKQPTKLELLDRALEISKSPIDFAVMSEMRRGMFDPTTGAPRRTIETTLGMFEDFGLTAGSGGLGGSFPNFASPGSTDPFVRPSGPTNALEDAAFIRAQSGPGDVPGGIGGGPERLDIPTPIFDENGLPVGTTRTGDGSGTNALDLAAAGQNGVPIGTQQQNVNTPSNETRRAKSGSLDILMPNGAVVKPEDLPMPNGAVVKPEDLPTDFDGSDIITPVETITGEVVPTTAPLGNYKPSAELVAFRQSRLDAAETPELRGLLEQAFADQDIQFAKNAEAARVSKTAAANLAADKLRPQVPGVDTALSGGAVREPSLVLPQLGFTNPSQQSLANMSPSEQAMLMGRLAVAGVSEEEFNFDQSRLTPRSVDPDSKSKIGTGAGGSRGLVRPA